MIVTVGGAGTRPTGSQTLVVQAGVAAFRSSIPNALVVFLMILGVFVGQIHGHGFIAVGRDIEILGISAFIISHLSSIFPVAMAQVAQGPCPPGGGNFCAG